MKAILVYDWDAELINALSRDNDISTASVVEMLLDHVEDVKEENELILLS